MTSSKGIHSNHLTACRLFFPVVVGDPYDQGTDSEWGSDPMRELMDDIERWRSAGHRVALARVVDIEGSGPRLPGASMAVADNGEVAGSVSGGCVEGAVVSEALDILSSGERRVVTFGYSDDEAFAVGLTCGGTIHLFIEPLDW